MRIAVTGASGLIGTALTSHLRAEGHDLVTFVRSDPAPAGSARWDPVAGTIDAEALEGVDAVVHLAGAPIGEGRWTPRRKAELLDSRVQGTRLIAETIAASPSPPSVLISASAIGFYGDTGDREVDETAPAGNDFLASVCTAWEDSAAPARDAGVRTVLARTGIVLSPEGGALARQLPVFRLGLGGRFGSGRQYQSWITRSDEVAALDFLIHHEVEGPVNLTAPEPVTNAEFTRTLGRVLHRPTTITPMFGPRLLFGRELADTLLLTSQRVLPRKLLAAGFVFSEPSLEEALRSLVGGDSGTDR